MNILAHIALRSLAGKARAFEASTNNPIEVQKKVLFDILKRNKDSEYGRKFGFENIRSIEDYQKAVPLCYSDALHPYIERMADGENGVLTSESPISFGLTSGTTHKSKLIPVTRLSRKMKADVTTLWSYYIYRDYPRVVDGKILAIVNPVTEGITRSGKRFGSETGHGYRQLPWFIRDMYVVPEQVFDVSEYNCRYYCILRLAMEKDVRTIAALNPTTLSLLCQKIDLWKDQLIQDIEKGTIRIFSSVPRSIRKILARSLRPNPKRAEELRKILKEKGKLLPKDFWPNLQVIETWKSGMMNLYLKELPQYFGDVPLRDFGYISTEARGSIPIDDDASGGVLAINSNFYEFIPKDEIDRDDRRCLTADKIEKGREYYIVVTTAGGLYRYNIDDIVKVGGFFNKTPMIEFVQKGHNAVSVSGEKLYESQVNNAVSRALDRNKLLVRFLSATVEMGNPPRYVFLAEFDDAPHRGKKRALLKAIEEELCKENQEYEYTRVSQLLGAPVLKVVQKGGLERYRLKRVGEGINDAQFKAPQLTDDPAFQDNFVIEEEIGLE